LPRYQLYDLTVDIGEENNLQAQQPGVLEQYRNELANTITEGRSTSGVKQRNDGPETWPQLGWMNAEEK
jgi:arylsulfatase A